MSIICKQTIEILSNIVTIVSATIVIVENVLVIKILRYANHDFRCHGQKLTTTVFFSG